jgi:maltose/moltooligosaccharide transporter
MKLNYGKTFLLGLGFFGVSVIWSVYNAYVPIFLKDRFFMATGFIGMFMTLDNVAALFIQPAVGAYSDRLHTRIGRRMPFIIASAPIAAISFAVMPMTASMFVFFLAALFLLLSMAVWRTPVISLMPDITPSKYRSQANGIINLMGGLGAIIAYFVGAKLYDMSPDYPFWLGAGLVLLSALLVFIFIKEPKTYEEPEEEKPQLIKSLGNILHEKDKSALFILLAILFWFISYSGIEAFFTLYAKEYLGFPESDGARLLGQLSLLFVIFALPAGYLGAAIGRRKTIMTGIVLMAIGIFSAYALSISTLTTVVTKLPILGNVPIIGLILMGIGIAWALININSLPMVVDMTDEAHNGTFTGLYYLFATLAAIIGPIMYGWIVQLSGNQYNLLMLVSPIFLVAAFAAMLFVRRGEAKKPLSD